MSNAVVSEGTFTAQDFIDTARLRCKSPKTRRIVDALLSAKDDREECLTIALEVIERLRVQAEVGQKYTPDKSLGFGSDNAAVIAEKLLGIGNSQSETRKAYTSVGSM